jgi:alpha-glucosidase
MAADLPENYEARLDVFQFIRDVPTDWETSKTLQGDIGDFIVVARLQRGGKDWFLGALTNENARKLTQSLSFLSPDKHYEAQIYSDGPGADYRTNPLPVSIERFAVTQKDILEIDMAPGGGTAIRFKCLD